MKFRNLFWAVAIAAFIGSGCMTVDARRFDNRLASWVPIGTPAEDAKRIMTKHGFRCELARLPSGDPSKDHFVCRRDNRFMNRSWYVELPLKKGKVSGHQTAISSDFFRMVQSNP